MTCTILKEFDELWVFELGFFELKPFSSSRSSSIVPSLGLSWVEKPEAVPFGRPSLCTRRDQRSRFRACRSCRESSSVVKWLITPPLRFLFSVKPFSSLGERTMWVCGVFFWTQRHTREMNFRSMLRISRCVIVYTIGLSKTLKKLISRTTDVRVLQKWPSRPINAWKNKD